MQNRILEVQAKNLFWPDRHYSYFFILDPQGGVAWDEPDGLFYDKRADMYHPGTYYPKTETCDCISVRSLGRRWASARSQPKLQTARSEGRARIAVLGADHLRFCYLGIYL